MRPRKAVKLGPQKGDSYDHLASQQLLAEQEETERRFADARRRLFKALEDDFQDYEPTLRPPNQRFLPWDKTAARIQEDQGHRARDTDSNPRPSKRRALPRSRSSIERLDVEIPPNPRTDALWASTHSSRTLWPNEQSNLPPVQDAARARSQAWLHSSGFPGAADPQIWEAICRNWIGFLSATGSMPKHELAPCRKVVQWGPRGSESPQAQKRRFAQDRKTRFHIQAAIWLQFDWLETRAEQWPAPVRTIVNRAGLGTEQGPFESWAAKTTLTQRRRGNSIFAALLCFLVYSHDEGTLEEMGLTLSEGLLDSIMDVTQAEVFHGRETERGGRAPGPVEEAVAELVIELITDPKATSCTNPLLWWIGVLVTSALQTDRDDYISRGRFDLNILTMDMGLEERVTALLHYSKVFILDYSMHTWKTSQEQMDEVDAGMAAVDMQWLDADDDQRPAASTDTRSCQSAAWKDVVKHVQAQCKAFLGDQPGTVARQVRVLLRGE